MTVKQLIEKLQQFPPDMLVTSEQSEWTYGAAVEVTESSLKICGTDIKSVHIMAPDQSLPDGSFPPPSGPFSDGR